jgi:hypothetical protein
MTAQSAVDYSNRLTAKLKGAGLVAKDIELSIQFSRLLSEAVKMRRPKLREEYAAGLSLEQEKAEDDRIFLGAALLLTQKMKPTKR